jgi:hypothetical protein
MAYAKSVLRPAKLLEKLGLHFEGMIIYAGTDEEASLFTINF